MGRSCAYIPVVIALVVAMLMPVAAIPARSEVADVSIESVTAESGFPSGATFRIEARASEPIVAAELLYAIDGQETLYLERAVIEPGTELVAELFLDLYNDFLPPGLRLVYFWRLTVETGAKAESDPIAFEWVDTRFDWKQLSTDQVSVRYYASDAGFAQSILDTAQRTIDVLWSDFGLPLPSDIRLWVYESKADFQSTLVPNSQDWIVGAALPDYGLILAVLPVGQESEVTRVVPHEITHQVMRQATKNPFNAPPLWFDEGFAVFQQQNGFDHFPDMIADAAAENRLLPLRFLTAEYPYDPADVTLSYAQGYSVVSFIVRRWGSASIGSLVSEFAKGISHDEAFIAALGVTVDELERLWKEDLIASGQIGASMESVDPDVVSGADDVIINATAILLVAAATVSGLLVIRRYRNAVLLPDELDGDAGGGRAARSQGSCWS